MNHATGAMECICCFERNCFGCALAAPSVGVCPVCGQGVRIGDFYEWKSNDPVHWDCLDEYREEEKWQ